LNPFVARFPGSPERDDLREGDEALDLDGGLEHNRGANDSSHEIPRGALDLRDGLGEMPSNVEGSYTGICEPGFLSDLA
jgi:hypothetical protein